MANIDTAFRVEGLSLNDKVGIFNGQIDPSSGLGFNAPTGSLFLRESGGIWKKIAAPDTSWVELGVGGSSFSTITSFLGLPASPALNDTVFYVPLNSIMVYDGTHWVGPKITVPIFGRGGKITASFWLLGVGKSKVFFSPPNRLGGYLYEGVSGSAYKFYNIFSNNQEKITGSIELHNNSLTSVPSFPLTGIIQAQHTNSLSASAEIPAGVFVAPNSLLQCFFNHSLGKIREIVVTVTYSQVAG